MKKQYKRRQPKKRIIRRKQRRIITKPNKPSKQIQQEAKPKLKNLTEMLILRKELSKKRPNFIRQESWRYRRIKRAWRKPKGIDSKMRLNVKGWPAIVKIGYRGPRIVRGLHPSGYRDILIHNINELNRINPKTDAARLASTLGSRKKMALLARAKQIGIKVLNIPKTKSVQNKGR